MSSSLTLSQFEGDSILQISLSLSFFLSMAMNTRAHAALALAGTANTVAPAGQAAKRGRGAAKQPTKLEAEIADLKRRNAELQARLEDAAPKGNGQAPMEISSRAIERGISQGVLFVKNARSC